ncbi:hypothetical protein CHN50_18595 [Priestia aryabhattai]|uniref:Uncharacterized protein n=1 Tax=Priestia veravalensis TaxID=1414648 RepID=A0A0V8JGV9_9BACI|nr:hypothetical protein AS180_19480 [Priestia veravalensis]OZT11100.1 hypothetical protein CHN50_18595 [Priestia aryabhattai]
MMKFNSYIAPIIFILVGLTCTGYSIASASNFHVHSNPYIWLKEFYPHVALLIVIIIYLLYIVLSKRKKQLKNRNKEK